MSRLVDRLRQRLAVLGGEPRLAETARAKAASALERAATTPAGIGDLLEGLDNADRQMQAQFRATAALIERKHLPPEIAARHRAFIADYQERLRQLRAALAPLATPIAADGASGPGSIDRQQARQALDQLDRLAPTTPPKPDLDRLRRRANPKQPGNRPRQHRGDYLAAGLHDNPGLRVAALGPVDYSQLPGADDPAYLGESDEIRLTPAILAKAAELDHNALEIYHWVRNHIEWLPSWGAAQQAEHVLATRQGNAQDIASLTIALLRASHIPARYAHGTIDLPLADALNWLGGFTDPQAAADYAASNGIPTGLLTEQGRVSAIRLEHIWVEAALDYHPSRGTRNRQADRWTPFDPSYKHYQYQNGLDTTQAITLDTQAIADAYLASGTPGPESTATKPPSASVPPARPTNKPSRPYCPKATSATQANCRKACPPASSKSSPKSASTENSSSADKPSASATASKSNKPPAPPVAPATATPPKPTPATTSSSPGTAGASPRHASKPSRATCKPPRPNSRATTPNKPKA